jgi:hypothetical protein
MSGLGTKRRFGNVRFRAAIGGQADIERANPSVAITSTRPSNAGAARYGQRLLALETALSKPPIRRVER